jgi:membrane glycosyltransferase
MSAIPAPARRRLFALIALAAASFLTLLLWRALAPGGWTGAKLVMFVSFLGTAPWTGICVANGLLGFLLLVFHRDPVRATFPIEDRLPFDGKPPRTAIALTVRNEDMATVLPTMRRLLDGLDRSGHGDRFRLCILSDTPDGPAAQAEAEAIAAFPAAFYRRRAENTGFKAGNIMEFLDDHAAEFELMLVLDADSDMSPEAVLRLVRAMQSEPRLGIVQHLTVGTPAASAFPRLFQFGMRAGMRSWATGQAWWQDAAGPYWGHNAIVRIAPFREHCRLENLPDGSFILSHDQVEAARLAAAGWAVRVLADETGSWEGNPPTWPEFMQRDARWLAGNFQYFALLRLPGFAPMGRWQLVQAILLFAGAPLYLLFLLAAAWAAATDSISFPTGPVLAVTLAWPGMLYLPKLLAYLEILLSRQKSRRYLGRAHFLGGIAAETVFTLLLDANAGVSKTLAMLRLALGAKESWAAQSRSSLGVGWLHATRLLWPHTLIGTLVFAAFATAGWRPVLWAIPFAGGLVVAIPFCVLTAHPKVGRYLKNIATIPEEAGLCPDPPRGVAGQGSDGPA